MNRISIVIVCKNEAGNIEKVLDSIRGISDDVVVYDSGSTDGTIDILKSYGVRLHQGGWMGFGKTKQFAIGLAKYDWILSIDADEAPDQKLAAELKEWEPEDERTVYDIRFKNYLGEKHLRWGEWGSDTHIRLFNRKLVNWNEAPVHESLIMPEGVKVRKLQGSIIHRTMKDTSEYSQKMVSYALLNAEKYYRNGKRSTWLKRFFSPLFSFVKHYIFMLGFLDGWEGLLSARMTAFYTFLKYARLHELHSRKSAT
ncbi:MAG TPA: glycosyltransferase family 2 protein [Flavisolibacter sp.]|jgi:glycosyltransferase involved in cell wall biosynthesis